MSKIKSAIVFTVITLIIAVLCFVCFVPFPLGGGINYFNPVINWTEKSADLGGYQFGEAADYLGGGFSIVYYPEGVIGEQEYTENLEALAGDEKKEEREEYLDKYVAYQAVGGRLYLEKETACGGKEEPTEEFLASCATQLKTLAKRFETLHMEGTVLEVCDELCMRASLPAYEAASVAAIIYNSYFGDVTLLYGTSSDAASATQVLPAPGGKKPIGDYIASVSAHSNTTSDYVQVDFTDEGLELVRSATSGAAESTGYIFVRVGENTVINLSVSEQVTDDLYISGSYTSETAGIVATVIDTAIQAPDSLGMTLGELHRSTAGYGTLQLGSLTFESITLVYIAFGVLFVAMMAFFFIRYRRLGFVHLYTYLTFLVLMVLIFWAVPIPLGVGTLVAFGLASVLLAVSNAIAFEQARKEYSVGKTIESSVKTGYRRCFWGIFDLHIVLLILSLLVYLIAVSELSMFALALLFGVALSGIGTLALNRFLWHIMMRLAKDAGKFCHYKREEVEDD